MVARRPARNVIGAGMLGRIDGASGAVNYYDFDLTGSVIGMSSAGGTYVNRYAYDPSGLKLLSSEAIANPYQYVGEFGVAPNRTASVTWASAITPRARAIPHHRSAATTRGREHVSLCQQLADHEHRSAGVGTASISLPNWSSRPVTAPA